MSAHPNIRWAQPGDQLIYSCELLDAREEGGMVSARATCGDRLIAEGEIVFAHVDKSQAGPAGANQKNFVFELGLLDVLDVGKAGDGT